jgi:hypothetical protein
VPSPQCAAYSRAATERVNRIAIPGTTPEGTCSFLGVEVEAPTERKTGVKRAEVIKARLLQDERGWLRLAG